MTTDEKREKLIETCLIGNKAPYNKCGCCEISESCRHAGHPPKYMGDEVVEMVYTDAVKHGKIKEGAE